MADLSERKKQNQAFLQELEKQRLAKDCNRSIDLRGKVAGECQQYGIGGCHHYLDDRSYLLLKQLMARVDGHYTVGVYEALLKAIRLYSTNIGQSDDENEGTPSFIPLDSRVERQEKRFIISTPVRIEHGDLRYNGNTIDLGDHSLRIALKRTHSLIVGDIVSISFSDWQQQQPALNAVSYQLLRLEHQPLNSIAILLRIDAEPLVDDWFQQWLQALVNARPVDADDKLVNLQSELYQRLWLSHQASIIVWLTATPPQIHTFHLSTIAQDLLQQQDHSLEALFTALPVEKLVNNGVTSYLLAMDGQHAYLGKLADEERIQQLLAWHEADEHRRLWQVSTQPVDITLTSTRQAILDSLAVNSDQMQKPPLSAITHQLILTDVTPRVFHSPSPFTAMSRPLSASALPPPCQLGSTIRRADERFYIHTPIVMHLDGKEISFDTSDVSNQGLAVQLPLEQNISVGQQLSVDFLRWQTLAPQIKLSHVPYQVKNKQLHNGQLHIGLQRMVGLCSDSLNQFFTDVIAQNQSKLRKNVQHQRQTIENQQLQDSVMPSLRAIPLFLGTDSNGKRGVQLIGLTQANRADAHRLDFWQTVSARLCRLNEPFNRQATKTCKTDFLFAYYTSMGQWKVALDSDFKTPQEKNIFIRLALKNAEFIACQCVFSPLRSDFIEHCQDILHQLAERPTHHSHREREIRQQLQRLYGIAELTDVTELTTLQYQS